MGSLDVTDGALNVATLTTEQLRAYVSNKPKTRSVLTSAEKWWANHQKWLEECGYMLRPRYLPGWKPSWEQDKNKSIEDVEDAELIGYPFTLDATRIKDGKFVMLKCISKTLHPYEADITSYLAGFDDPYNHTIPLYDVLEVPDDPDAVILATALGRQFDNPRFDTVGEVVEFFRQIFEGLKFMHEHHVAHRDCMDLNIMMDATPLYPVPYHPRRIDWRRDFKGPAKSLPRTQCPVKYYFIDFGISRRYDSQGSWPPLEEPIFGGDQTVPEFQTSSAAETLPLCDPFATDVYYIGNMIRRTFTEGCELNSKKLGLEFMEPLVNKMVQDDPANRPKAVQIAERFAAISSQLTEHQLRRRVAKAGDSIPHSVVLSARHLARRVSYTMHNRPPVPKP